MPCQIELAYQITTIEKTGKENSDLTGKEYMVLYIYIYIERERGINGWLY
jgi:hypothetical protein